MFLLAIAGIELSRFSDRIAAVWLANGAVLAVLLRSPRKDWLPILAASMIGNIAANLFVGDAIGSALGLACCNAIEIALAAALCSGRPQRNIFDAMVMARFVLVVVAASFVSAVAAVSILAPPTTAESLVLLRQWWIADALGLIILTPVGLALRRSWILPKGRRDWIDSLLVLGGASVATALVFSSPAPRLFLLTPALLFTGFRLRPGPSAVVATAIAAIAIVMTVEQLGPIAAAPLGPEAKTLLAQAFIATCFLLTLPVSALTRDRDRLDDRLRRSERQFRLLAEASPSAIVQCDLEGRPAYANGRWTELFGHTLAAVRCRGWESVFVPEVQNDARSIWDQAQRTRIQARATLPCVFASRGEGWADLFVTPERAADDEVVGWVVRIMDATQRVNWGRALEESETQYRLLADNSRDIIMRLTPDGRKKFVSAAVTRMLGIDPEQMVGKPAYSFIHPEDHEIVRDALARAVDGSGEQVARYRKRRSDDGYLWVEAVYTAVVEKGTVEIVASVRDIDRRHRAERAAAESARKLEESNRLLTMAEEMALIGHCHFDRASSQIDLSGPARDILDFDPVETVDPTAMLERVDRRDRMAVRRAIVWALDGKPHSPCRVRLIPFGDEPARTVQLSIHGEFDTDGQAIGLFGVVQDITAKVADEGALLDALKDAKAAAQAKSAFLATMSHEIRTPMTGVLGMIDLLRGDVEPSEREQYLGTLKQSADLLMTVLNDVLDFSKMEHGMLHFRPCDFDFEELAQSTLDLFFNAASKKGLLIGLEVDADGSPFVHGDPIRLQQVMSNLINNAIKFTDSGSVKVRLTAADASDGPRRWRLEVRDTGIGIAEADRASLFEPFTQADGGDLRRFGGTGLGLAISRRLVEAMDGTIGVDSRVGEGSTFWFEVPLGAAETTDFHAISSPSRGAAKEVRSERGLAILVAEDNPVNQLLVSALLKRQGHVPTCVANGLEAVAAASQRRFDCILMDMQMPEMDGVGATRMIRQSGGPSADIPIIALTADASPERRRFYDQAGLTDFMTKPIDGAALEARLAAIGAQPADVGDAFDGEHLERLAEALGPIRLRSLLDLFKVELERRPPLLAKAADNRDWAQLAGEAHSLKGAALSIGATPLAEAASRLEQSAGEGDEARIPADCEGVRAAVTATLTALPGAILEPHRREA